MLKRENLMDNKNSRLDFGAPLLSVRRFSSEPEPANSRRPNPVPKRSALPFYKSDLKSGPIRNPGVIPFLWEQSPGQPKPSPAKIQQPQPADDEEEEEKFCDALDTLSCTESAFLNCSVSGISEAQEGRTTEAAPSSSGSFSTDARVRDFMMGRFLPAAKAMAAESASPAKKLPQQNQERGMRRVVAVESGEQRRMRYPMDCEHGVGLLKNEEEEEEEEEEEDEWRDGGTGVMRLRGCGLIPRLCLLSPVPGMRVSSGRLRGTSVRRVRPGGTQQVRTVLHDRCILKAEEEVSISATFFLQ